MWRQDIDYIVQTNGSNNWNRIWNQIWFMCCVNKAILPIKPECFKIRCYDGHKTFCLGSLILYTLSIYTYRQKALFPLSFKLRKLKLKIRLMEMRQFRKNYHISQKHFYSRMRWFLRQFEKGIFRKTAMAKFFSAFTGHMAYVKMNIIILQCTLTSKKHVIRGRSRI